SHLLRSSWIYEDNWSSACPACFIAPVEARSPPRDVAEVLSHRWCTGHVIQDLRRFGDDGIGLPGLGCAVGAEVAPAHRDLRHAGRARGVDVALVVTEVNAIRRRHADCAACVQ